MFEFCKFKLNLDSIRKKISLSWGELPVLECIIPTNCIGLMLHWRTASILTFTYLATSMSFITQNHQEATAFRII